MTYDSQRYRYGFDTWRHQPRSPDAFLDSFARECERVEGPKLAQWLSECPETDPAYPIIRAELAKRDALPLLNEDDLSCFDDELTREARFWDGQYPEDHDWIPSGGLL